jgi:hypothetical protein
MSIRRFLTRSTAGLLTLVGTSLGCDGRAQLPTGSSQVTAQPGDSARPPIPSGAVITAVLPNTGGTGGATLVQIVGTGLRGSSHVTFGGLAASRVGWSPDGTVVSATTPPGSAGTVDIVVSNPVGQTTNFPQGFTYGVAPTLLVTQISPNVGATAGGTYLTLTGSGFQAGATVTIDGVDTAVLYQSIGTGVALFTRPHQAGTVDVVVTNPDGQVARLTGAYTYSRPQFRDFNGDWEGRLGDEGEAPLRFTVQNDVLVSVSCASAPSLTFSPASTSGGEFSIVAGARIGMTGALLRADYAEGTITFPTCTGYDTVWSAKRR